MQNRIGKLNAHFIICGNGRPGEQVRLAPKTGPQAKESNRAIHPARRGTVRRPGNGGETRQPAALESPLAGSWMIRRRTACPTPAEERFVHRSKPAAFA